MKFDNIKIYSVDLENISSTSILGMGDDEANIYKANNQITDDNDQSPGREEGGKAEDQETVDDQNVNASRIDDSPPNKVKEHDG